MIMNNKIHPLSTARLVALELLYVMFLSLSMALLSFLIGGAITPFTFPAAVAVVFAAAFFIARKSSVANVWKSFLWATGIILLSVALSAMFNDRSYDGQAYHQLAIINMMNGWNPYYGVCPQQNGILNLWVDHYAKGAETMSATIAATFRNVESGKAIFFILGASTMLAVYDRLRLFLEDRKPAKLMLLALLIAFPAVVVGQMFTFYIDWILFFLFVQCFLCLYNLQQGRTRMLEYASLSVILVFATCIKFNFLFWVGVMLLVYAAILIREKNWKDLKTGLAVSTTAVVLGVFLFGFNPYITNLTGGHHILYPLMGEGAVDIMTNNTPEELRPYGYFSKVVISLLSVPSNWRLSFYPPPGRFQRIRN